MSHSISSNIGSALYIICAGSKYQDYPIASLKNWVVNPAKLKQLHVFTNTEGKKVGYVTWAWFSHTTELRWINNDISALHISEWNEGDRLWIIDLVSMPGELRSCLEQAKLLFMRFSVAHSLCRRRNENNFITSWTLTGRRTSFLAGVSRKLVQVRH